MWTVSALRDMIEQEEEEEEEEKYQFYPTFYKYTNWT